MRRALDLYFRLISIQIRSQMQYRVSFWLEMISTGILSGVYFLTLALIFERFGNIQGWSLGEVAFLAGLVEMSFGTMDLIFSGFDYNFFSTGVRLGSFDQKLLRPVNITLQVLGSKFMLRRLGRIAEGLVIFIFALTSAPIQWTIVKLIYLPVVFVSQIMAFGSLFIMGSTLTFWTMQPIEAVNILTYGGNELMTYPATIYPAWLRNFFTYLIPFVFLNYYPGLFFLDKPDPLGFPVFAPFLAPVVAGTMLAVSMWFWRFGINHYQSTGS
jgi:ABC-2 type transport system permease protein